jgi:hypothetical protein
VVPVQAAYAFALLAARLLLSGARSPRSRRGGE